MDNLGKYSWIVNLKSEGFRLSQATVKHEDMNNKTFALFLLLGGIVLLLVGVGVALDAMNQVIESPFITNVNGTWNTETVAVVIALIGVFLILFGILILF